MAFKIISVPLNDGGGGEAELNAFLRGHRVLSVDRRWVDQGASSFWCFCIDYLETVSNGYGGNRAPANRGKIDYKEVLKPEEFVVFAQLRDLRKELAQIEGVPMYTILTNEQLAKIVQGRVKTKAELAKVSGIGEARIEKYGKRVLDLLAKAWRAAQPGADEPGASATGASGR